MSKAKSPNFDPNPLAKSLVEARSKILWAIELIDALKANVEKYLESKPYKINLEKSEDEGGWVFGVTVSEPIPGTIPCILGDIVSNLRGSMDYSWHGLRRSYGYKGEATFPVQSDSKGLESIIDRLFREAERPLIRTLLIERNACHHDIGHGGNSVLSDLNKLRNLQKHESLIPFFGVTKLPPDTVLRSSDGGVIMLGNATVNGNRIALMSGDDVELHYSGEPTVELMIRTPKRRTPPVRDVILEYYLQAIQIQNDITELWPSELNPKPMKVYRGSDLLLSDVRDASDTKGQTG